MIAIVQIVILRILQTGIAECKDVGFEYIIIWHVTIKIRFVNIMARFIILTNK